MSFSFNDAYLSFTTFVKVAMMTHFNISISGRDFLSGGSFQPGERRFGRIFKPDFGHFHKIVVNKSTSILF